MPEHVNKFDNTVRTSEITKHIENTIAYSGYLECSSCRQEIPNKFHPKVPA